MSPTYAAEVPLPGSKTLVEARVVSNLLMRLALSLSLAMVDVLALPPAAGASPKPNDLVGLWAGTIRDQAIIACFEKERALYYYLRYGRDLELTRDSRDSAAWHEAPSDSATGETGIWRLVSVGAGNLTGTWSPSPGPGARTAQPAPAPIQLHRQPMPGEDGQQACSSAEYFRPHYERLKKTYGTTFEKAGHRYRSVKIGLGDVELLELVDTDPASRALRLALERIRNEYISRVETCLGLAARANYHLRLSIVFTNIDWITFRARGDFDCGGAHPGEVFEARTLDASTGASVDTTAWIDWGKDPGILPVLSRHYKLDADCFDALTYDWSVWPSSTGLVVEPSLPHVSAACRAEIDVAFAEVAPHLTASGKQAVARLRSQRQP